MEQEPQGGISKEEEAQILAQDRKDQAEWERIRPRIWVGSLADYNAGILHGEWINADRDAEEVWQDIHDMLKQSPTPGAEEWGVFDYEGFGGVPIAEYHPIEAITALACGIREHGLAFAGWAGLRADAPNVGESFEYAYLGEWDSIEAFADNIIEDLGIQDVIDRLVPEDLRHYVTIDIRGLARDLEMSGDIITVDVPGGGVWVYDGRV